jgi:vitamin-K-epoxide reductase (warfarin-sensitive)
MRYLIAALAVAGIVVSTLALRVHNSTDTQPCSINEKWDCGVVNHSEYAEIGHVPVATIGIAGYSLLTLLSLCALKRLTLLAAVGGFAFALYLTFVESRILHVWCLYCVTSQAIIAAIALLSAIYFFQRGPQRETLR